MNNSIRLRFSFVLSLFLGSLFVMAQTPVENGFLEEWIYNEGGDYYEPSGYWATSNAISKLSAVAPVTTFREEEIVFAGNYAAKMVTGTFVTLPVAGTIYTGEFDDTEIVNPIDAVKLGVPYTSRPERFMGYYLYEPVRGDSAAISCQFTKYINGETQIVGEGTLAVYNVVAAYTPFDLKINYYTTETPDTMIVAFSSSAGGQDFMGEEGSTLYIDEVLFEFDTGLFTPLMPEIVVTAYPNPTADQLWIQTERQLVKGTLTIHDNKGIEISRHTLEGTNTKLDTSHLMDGHYHYQVIEKGRVIAGHTLTIIK